jgi:radical SAM superfamily enzyme YgiQ (UPF0313 family)
VFSSANVLRSYSVDQLVALGISWVWMGLEGENSQYAKLHGTDAFALVKELQEHGIRVLGSTIVGLENHTPENIDRAIDHAVRYDTDFHQFMLYTAMPGTPLHAELSAQGRVKNESECPQADVHGQLVFNHRHPHIRHGQESEMLVRAFRRDFDVNGPSIARIVRTALAGWNRYKNHPNRRIRRRYAWESRELAATYSAVLWAMRRYYRKNPAMRAKMSRILRDLHEAFGWKSRLAAAVLGPYVLWKSRREEKRLSRGWTYEPPTFYETNHPADPPVDGDGPRPVPCSYVTPRVFPKPPARRPVAEPVSLVGVK